MVYNALTCCICQQAAKNIHDVFRQLLLIVVVFYRQDFCTVSSWWVLLFASLSLACFKLVCIFPGGGGVTDVSWYVGREMLHSQADHPRSFTVKPNPPPPPTRGGDATATFPKLPTYLLRFKRAQLTNGCRYLHPAATAFLKHVK